MVKSRVSFVCEFAETWRADECLAFISCVSEIKKIAKVIETREDWKDLELVRDTLPESHKKILNRYIGEIIQKNIASESCDVELDLELIDPGLSFNGETSIMTDAAAKFISIFLHETGHLYESICIEVGYTGDPKDPADSGGAVWFITSDEVKHITTCDVIDNLVAEFQHSRKRGY